MVERVLCIPLPMKRPFHGLFNDVIKNIARSFVQLAHKLQKHYSIGQVGVIGPAKGVALFLSGFHTALNLVEYVEGHLIALVVIEW